MIFHQSVGVWDLRQLDQLPGVPPSPNTPPPPGRMSSQEGLPSWVPHCHVDLALNPSNSMLWWRATFHLGQEIP